MVLLLLRHFSPQEIEESLNARGYHSSFIIKLEISQIPVSPPFSPSRWLRARQGLTGSDKVSKQVQLLAEVQVLDPQEKTESSKMADNEVMFLEVMPVLEQNGTNGTNSSTAANQDVPGGIDGYVHTMYVVALSVAIGSILLVWLLWGWWYRRRAHRKEREAGNVNVAISRPNPK